jgi:hypothetical protein
VHEDADIALPELFRRYCKHYKVNAHEVPWLGWGVRTPLEIRLIAEEFCGSTLTHDDGLRANVMDLFQRKLSRMEDEDRTAAGAKAWNTGLPLLSTILSVIVALTRDLRQLMAEDRDIIRLVQENDTDLLSALALVPLRFAQVRQDWVQHVLIKSTKGNREALRRVVIPVAQLAA